MRFDLSDEEWSVLEPLMRVGRGAPARPADHKSNILRVADRDPVARFARTLRPVHERVQSALEAYFRCAGGKIARQFVLDR
jgi:transposase